MPFLYCISDSSRKFWQIDRRVNMLQTRYGRIGSEGSLTSKALPDADQAKAELKKQVRQKIAKGYRYPHPEAMPPAQGEWPERLQEALPVMRGMHVPPWVQELKPLQLTLNRQPERFPKHFPEILDEIRGLELLVNGLLAGERFPGHAFINEPAVWESLLCTLLQHPDYIRYPSSAMTEDINGIADAALTLLGLHRFLEVMLTVLQRTSQQSARSFSPLKPVLSKLRHGIASLSEEEYRQAAEKLQACYDQANTNLKVVCNYLLPTERNWTRELVRHYQQDQQDLNARADYASLQQRQIFGQNIELLLECDCWPSYHLWLCEQFHMEHSNRLQAFWLRCHGGDCLGMFGVCLRNLSNFPNEVGVRDMNLEAIENLLYLGYGKALSLLLDHLDNQVVYEFVSDCCMYWPLFVRDLLQLKHSSEAMHLLAFVEGMLASTPQQLSSILLRLAKPETAELVFDDKISALRATGRITGKPAAAPTLPKQLSKAARSQLPVVRGLHVPPQVLVRKPLLLDFGAAYTDLVAYAAPLKPLQDWLAADEALRGPETFGTIEEWEPLFDAALLLLQRAQAYTIHPQVNETLAILMAAGIDRLGPLALAKVFLNRLRSFGHNNARFDFAMLLPGLKPLRHALAQLPDEEYAAIMETASEMRAKDCLGVLLVWSFLFPERSAWAEELLGTRLETGRNALYYNAFTLLHGCLCGLDYAVRLHEISGLPWSEEEILLRVLEHGARALTVLDGLLQRLENEENAALERLLRKLMPTLLWSETIDLLASLLHQPLARVILADMTIQSPQLVRQQLFKQPLSPVDLYLWLKLLA